MEVMWQLAEREMMRQITMLDMLAFMNTVITVGHKLVQI